MEHFAQSVGHNGASDGANSNQATIVRCVFAAALSGPWRTMAQNVLHDRDVEAKR